MAKNPIASPRPKQHRPDALAGEPGLFHTELTLAMRFAKQIVGISYAA